MSDDKDCMLAVSAKCGVSLARSSDPLRWEKAKRQRLSGLYANCNHCWGEETMGLQRTCMRTAIEAHMDMEQAAASWVKAAKLSVNVVANC